MPGRYTSRTTYPRRKNIRVRIRTKDADGKPEPPTRKEQRALTRELKKASPVKTGRLRRSWRTTKDSVKMLASNFCGYAAYVNRRGKHKGFVRKGIKAWAAAVERTRG